MFSSIVNGSEIIGGKHKLQERVKMYWPIVTGNEDFVSVSIDYFWNTELIDRTKD